MGREGISRPRHKVTSAKIAAGVIVTADIADSGITTAKLASTAVTKAKALVFASTEQTGNGSEQSIAHGLGAAPSIVMVCVTEVPDAAAETGFDVAEGTHTATNVLVTVTNTVKYKVFAWA